MTSFDQDALRARIKGYMAGKHRIFVLAGILFIFLVLLSAWKTISDLEPLPESLKPDLSRISKPQLLARNGVPLSVTYENRWNVHNYVPLHDIPLLIQESFIRAEDKRFYSHNGPDWSARFHALFQNLAAWDTVRGASTITEQVVRMIHPRERTLWSRWIEGFEAAQLERRFSKADIIEFYLNQVPYAARKRGIVQAARYYFNRDLDTLSLKEMLTLSILVRAPGRLDPYSNLSSIEKPAAALALVLRDEGLISNDEYREVLVEKLALCPSDIEVKAGHFASRIYRDSSFTRRTAKIFTTLDSTLQKKTQKILDTRLDALKSRNVSSGAVLVVDHSTDEVLAWVNSGGELSEMPESHIDRVVTPRQPGSTLKPFLYALALEKGWTAATLIDDSPLASRVGSGLHAYHNYSRHNYGPLRLREALGNSLNIPAIRTAQFTGLYPFFDRLQALGFESLDKHPDYYGEGLALGNGEVTLYELARAYAALARRGVYRPLKTTLEPTAAKDPPRQIYSGEISSLIADILSDPQARHLEFGSGSLFRFPVQTAVKTGTSSDYRDAWAIGFSFRNTVGVWMGNLDRRPMKEVTGSFGPAVVLRAVFAELNRHRDSRPLYLSPRLGKSRICRISGMKAGADCPSMDEWFEPGKAPEERCKMIHRFTEAEKSGIHSANPKERPLRLVQPTNGLQLAMDPRIPDDKEFFPFILPGDLSFEKVDWLVDGEVDGSTPHYVTQFPWKVSRGTHHVVARVWLEGDKSPIDSDEVRFYVK